MISTGQIQLFMEIFTGRRDVYARRWEKNDKSGYSPAYQFSWPEFLGHKKKGGTMASFANKTTLPLTMEAINNHLEGRDSLGMYPLRADGNCHLLVVDFDKSSWRTDAPAFVAKSQKYGLVPCLEISRSGNGAHVWILFADWYPAVKARTIIKTILDQAFEFSTQEENSYDRMFPNQDFLEEGGLGNLIALPLQGTLIPLGKSVFVDPETLEPYPDQWRYLKSISRVTFKQLDKLHTKLLKGKSGITRKKNGKLNIHLGKMISIAKTDLAPELSSFLKKELNFLNPGFVIKERMGLSTYKTERFFKLIQESADQISLPRGFLTQLLGYCHLKNIDYVLEDDRLNLPKTTFKSKIEAYDYQQEIIDKSLNHDSGVIVAPPGGGKTVIGLSLIEKQSLSALILVHRAQLLSQWKERITQFLGVPKKEIGQFSGFKKKLGKQITVAMMQTLTRLNESEIADIASKVGTIVIDECHHIPATTFREVIVQFNPKYIYGLTATPQRKYHDESLIFHYIGPIVAILDQKPTVSGALFSGVGDSQPKTKLVIRSTALNIPFTPRVDQYDLLSKLVIFNDTRNLQIVSDILGLVKQGKKTIILTERKDHVDVLSLYLRGKAEIITLTGDDSVKSRREKMVSIQQGNFQILIATGQLLGEGFDLPILDALVLAYPFSFEGKLIQYVGRIERGNQNRIIYDYHDELTPVLSRMYKSRLRHYKMRGWVQ
ncbi:MAG: DEAD/DEAH box helicase family protein [Patescibacteria group bacterium]